MKREISLPARLSFVGFARVIQVDAEPKVAAAFHSQPARTGLDPRDFSETVGPLIEEAIRSGQRAFRSQKWTKKDRNLLPRYHR